MRTQLRRAQYSTLVLRRTIAPRAPGGGTCHCSICGLATASGSLCCNIDFAAGDVFDVIDNRNEIRLDSIPELRIDVVTLARLHIDLEGGQIRSSPTWLRTADDHDVLTRSDLDGISGIRAIAIDRLDHRRPAVEDRHVVASATDFTPGRAPGLAATDYQNESQNCFTHDRPPWGNARRLPYSLPGPRATPCPGVA